MKCDDLVAEVHCTSLDPLQFLLNWWLVVTMYWRGDEDECEGVSGISMIAEWCQALPAGVVNLDMALYWVSQCSSVCNKKYFLGCS